MKFVDVINIDIKAGDGGDGVISFLQELHQANGGPDGGTGGIGGSVYFRADNNITTLFKLSKRRMIKAENGRKGTKKNRTGGNGDDLIISVPLGSVITNRSTNQVISNITDLDTNVLIAKGGRGGKGNAAFRTKENRVPRVCENGGPGEILKIKIELKIIADIGIIGFPNSGKSTLISIISAAKPKIADFEFTTLIPNIGIVTNKNYETIVIADIPGLIEGASEGKGLGLSFLRHIERCYGLVHLLDGQLNDFDLIIERYKIINEELSKYDTNLGLRKQIVCLNKIELVDEEIIDKLKTHFKDLNIELFLTSSFTRKNLQELIDAMYKMIHNHNINTENDNTKPKLKTRVITLEQEPNDDIVIFKKNKVWFVQSAKVEAVVLKIPLLTPQSYTLVNNKLEYLGVFKSLRESKIQENDEVDIYGYRFEWEG